MRKTSLIAVLTASLLAASAALAAGGNSSSNNGSGNTSSGNNSSSTQTTPTSAAAPTNSSNSPGSNQQGAGLASGADCYTAVYDQQNDQGTFAHYGKGEWDSGRQLCMHVGKFTQSFLKDVTAVEAAKNNPFIHVMYVIDRTQDKLYAPCGANSESQGVLSPGTYDLNSLTKLDSDVPNLGAGANCLITG